MSWIHELAIICLAPPPMSIVLVFRRTWFTNCTCLKSTGVRGVGYLAATECDAASLAHPAVRLLFTWDVSSSAAAFVARTANKSGRSKRKGRKVDDPRAHFMFHAWQGWGWGIDVIRKRFLVFFFGIFGFSADPFAKMKRGAEACFVTVRCCNRRY